MKKVAFRNLGCKVNEYEMEYMQQIMSQNGYMIVPFDQNADIYVVNTCTVTNIADRKSRQMLHQAKKRNPEAIVVAAGCYVETDTEGAKKDEAIDIIVGNNDKNKLPQIIEDYEKSRGEKRIWILEDSVNAEYADMHIEKTAEHTRAFVKIQDGCNQFCSYCAIPLARGRIRSRTKESIEEEIRALSLNGYKEVVLTGIHLSSFGIDKMLTEDGRAKSYNELAEKGRFTNEALLEVIELVSKIEGIERIRLGSLEPRLISESFAMRLSKIEKICPHFHLSLQSGSNETLKRMNRKYNTDEFYESVCILRKYFDNPAITTDVIVGFPGETDEEFNECKSFLEKVSFFELHVFKYSKRKGTLAAGMKMQIADEVKDKRSAELLTMDEKLSRQYRQEHFGKKVKVLYEECRDGIYTGHSKEYIKLGKRSDKNISGMIIEEIIDGEEVFFI